MNGELLRVAGLAVGYGGAPVIEGIDFTLDRGERIGVLGPNGGGKSTLFRALLGELRPLRGSIIGPERFGYVPQTERSRLDYPVSPLDVALMGTLTRVPWWRPVGRAERRFAAAALDRVGLAERADRQFGELSGGQRQRVLIARALVQDAPVLLLDEPFSGVDVASAELIGISGGVLGCWIVFYELSYSAESLAHSLFPGLVLAALLGFPLILGAAAGVAAAAAAVVLASRVPGIDRDTSVGVVITSLFGAGVLLALSPASPPGIGGLLFGDLLGVSSSDLITAGVLAGAVLAALAAMHRQLLAVGFDRSSAPAIGGKPLLADLALLGLIAAATLIAVQGLGNLLVVAVLVAPAATARVLTRRIVRMMIVAAALALGCGMAGLYLSSYANTAAGASVAGSLVVAFLVATTVKRALAH